MAALGGIKQDDIVRADVRGQKFWAIVSKPAHTDSVRGRGIAIRGMSESANLPTYFLKANQVIGHWRKAKGATVDV